MRQLLTVLAVIGAAFGGYLWSYSTGSGALTKTANGFFDAVAAKDDAARAAFLAKNFSASTTPPALDAFLQQTGLDTAEAVDWSDVTRTGARGTMFGSAKTAAGEFVRLDLRLVEEDDGWKIYSMRQPTAGVLQGGSPASVPPEREQIALVRETMWVYAQSVKAESMAAFRDHASVTWQAQTSTEQFDQTYGGLYGQNVDLTVLNTMPPQFDREPRIGTNGVMTITGQYPTKPKTVYFEQDYVFEGLGWKLIGFSTQVK